MYKLNSKEDKKLFNEVSGIYKLIYHTPEFSNDQVIYVGQSKKVGKRLSSHSHPETKIKEIINKIQIEWGKVNRTKQLALYLFIQNHIDEIYFEVVECSIEELDRLEEEIITEYQPRYNYAGVDIPYKGEINNGMVSK